MDAQTLLQLLQDGGLTVYPLGLASVVTLAILFERMWRYKGLESQTRAVTRETIELQPGERGELRLAAHAPTDPDCQRRLITAEVCIDGISQGPIGEALVTVV